MKAGENLVRGALTSEIILLYGSPQFVRSEGRETS